MHIYNRDRGFTFLEVILVLFLMSIIASAVAPQLLKSKSDDVFLSRTQQEMEARQNAARWYYNDYTAWPASAAVLKTPAVNTNNPAGTPYLNVGCSETSPFGTAYVFTSDTNTFSVSVTAPNDLAHRLGSRLVSPAYTPVGTTQTTVTTTVSKPGQDLALQNFTDLKTVDIVNPGATIVKPTCPAGKTASIYITPVNFMTGNSGQPVVGVNAYATDDGLGNWVITANVRGSDNVLYTDLASLKIQVFAICR